MMAKSGSDLKRCEEAWRLSAAGYTTVKIAAMMGVTQKRASYMIKTWVYHEEEEDARRELAAYRNGKM